MFKCCSNVGSLLSANLLILRVIVSGVLSGFDPAGPFMLGEVGREDGEDCGVDDGDCPAPPGACAMAVQIPKMHTLRLLKTNLSNKTRRIVSFPGTDAP